MIIKVNKVLSNRTIIASSSLGVFRGKACGFFPQKGESYDVEIDINGMLSINNLFFNVQTIHDRLYSYHNKHYII